MRALQSQLGDSQLTPIGTAMPGAVRYWSGRGRDRDGDGRYRKRRSDGGRRNSRKGGDDRVGGRRVEEG